MAINDIAMALTVVNRLTYYFWICLRKWYVTNALKFD